MDHPQMSEGKESFHQIEIFKMRIISSPHSTFGMRGNNSPFNQENPHANFFILATNTPKIDHLNKSAHHYDERT